MNHVLFNETDSNLFNDTNHNLFNTNNNLTSSDFNLLKKLNTCHNKDLFNTNNNLLYGENEHNFYK